MSWIVSAAIVFVVVTLLAVLSEIRKEVASLRQAVQAAHEESMQWIRATHHGISSIDGKLPEPDPDDWRNPGDQE